MLNSKPIVSIGIPFFNARETLADAIRSVFCQSFQDWELLLVDDGSIDGSLEMAKRVDDPRVRVIVDGVNRGLIARLNQIASIARGHYLVRMDADDLMHPMRLEKQLEFMEGNREINFCGTWAYVIDEFNRIKGIRKRQYNQTDKMSLLKSRFFIHPSMIGLTKFFLLSPYDSGYYRCEDLELWCRLVKNHSFFVLEEPLLFYRDPTRIKLTNYINTEKTRRKILRNYGPDLVGSVLSNVMIIESVLKSGMYRVFDKVGFTQVFIKARNVPLSREEIQIASHSLEEILTMPIPYYDA